jgi:hypothetical protein
MLILVRPHVRGSARCLDSVRGGETGAIFEAIIGGEVSLYFAQALREGTRK